MPVTMTPEPQPQDQGKGAPPPPGFVPMNGAGAAPSGSPTGSPPPPGFVPVSPDESGGHPAAPAQEPWYSRVGRGFRNYTYGPLVDLVKEANERAQHEGGGVGNTVMEMPDTLLDKVMGGQKEQMERSARTQQEYEKDPSLLGLAKTYGETAASAVPVLGPAVRDFVTTSDPAEAIGKAAGVLTTGGLSRLRNAPPVKSIATRITRGPGSKADVTFNPVTMATREAEAKLPRTIPRDEIYNQRGEEIIRRGEEQEKLDTAHEQQLKDAVAERQKELADAEKLKQQHAESLQGRGVENERLLSKARREALEAGQTAPGPWSPGRHGDGITPEELDAAARRATGERGVSVVPEPRSLFPGENPNYMASVEREGQLPELAGRGKPGAGTQLQQLGKPVLYEPREAGYPPPRSRTLLDVVRESNEK